MILSITLSADWIQKIIQADQELFLLLNKGYTNSFLDAIFPWYREGNAWVPFYLFLVVFSILNFGKKAFPFILFAVITIVLTDQISSSLVKPFFERPRPCRDPYLMNQIRMLLNGCSGGYSFTSSHATNHFGFAVYLLVTIGSMIGKWKYLLLVWAATIAYGQVYVGVHYPLDIFFGALLGSLIGWITGYWHNRTAEKISLAEIYNTI
ncbi:phosphatase PAP2 family protein [Sediminibacterium sp. C3]|uniref:phosphatase PAP2 family protein n=1 Tax=Sediminibacterium sp. C3 TaxID=1267211 RepID=UPI000423B808|nr:phosphatase PAP2 family protein [Sediminibacterium sp. C3]